MASTFLTEAARVAEVLGPMARAVEHYGSTSVPGLPAKPILDLLVGTDNFGDPEPFAARLESLGYEYAYWAGVPGHQVFGRGEPRTHLLHLVQYDGPSWRDALRFRDRLRDDVILREDYAALKRELAVRFPTDRPRYTAEKSVFIERVVGSEGSDLSPVEVQRTSQQSGDLLMARFSLLFDSPAAEPGCLSCHISRGPDELKSSAEIATDFDAIATALRTAPPERHLTAAQRAVLDAIPPTARRGLDVGCGDGLLARVVAARGVSMIAIDLAPQMIALAKDRTDSRLPIVYHVADIMSAAFAPQAFDVVFSVNMVHHLPLDVVLPHLVRLVAPGGRLIIQDVVTRVGFRHLPVNIAAAFWRRLRHFGRRAQATRTVQLLYDRHGIGETYLTPPRVAQTLTPFLPGVTVTHHLDWRYTAVWNRALNSRVDG